MTTFVFLSLHPTFDEASDIARAIAVAYAEETVVKPENAQWKVLVPYWIESDVKNGILPKASNPEDDELEALALLEEPEEDEDDYDATADEEYRRELDEIREDIYGAQEDWGRSQEAGWYYPDTED